MKKKKKKKIGGLTHNKEKYGLMFISPWIIGLLLFFLLPVGQSLYYSACDVKLTKNGLQTAFVGLKNYDYIINANPLYLGQMIESLRTIGYSLPVIVIVSLIIALILNQKFKGRIFFRALYFLPVIIASGVVVELLFSVNSEDLMAAGVSNAVSNNSIDFGDIILKLGISGKVGDYLTVVFSSIFELVWSSGIQIILFISGMQSIPDSLYEAARVEGCTKWEEFWFITLPMLSRIMMLVLVFTIVELLTTKTNGVMSLALNAINNLEYGVGAAMAWLYFILIGVVLATVLYVLDRVWIRRWR